ncbi:MAG: adenine phosphoribosyltransferase [SAR202 cluster bacterium]|nr:adenine phosphoribosyltransferase [SAR202 cluster bacterium]
MDLKKHIRDIPNFPKPGILFKDITPLLKDPDAFACTIDMLAERYTRMDVDAVLGIDARGFLFAAPLAYKMRKPLVPVRKHGKLPFNTKSVKYEFEYGDNVIEVHVDGVIPGQRVVIVDDLLATGGTLAASARLVEESGGVVAELAVVVELSFLKGRDRLKSYSIHSLMQY